MAQESSNDPIYFGIKKQAITAWVRLGKAMDEEQNYPCREKPYYYMDYDGYGFLTEDGDASYQALTQDDCDLLCHGCPLIKLCYDFAVLNEEKHGVWGGINFEHDDKMKNGRLF